MVLSYPAPYKDVVPAVILQPPAGVYFIEYESRTELTGESKASAQAVAADMAALIKAVAEKSDHAAFATLFAHYAPRLKSFLMRQASPEAAEEIAQEAMLSVWRKAAQFDSTKASAGTWIFTIARNLRIDRLRREGRPEVDMTDPYFDQDEPTPDQNASASEEQKIIHEAVSQLPEDQAEVIRLAYFEEQSHSEIADSLDIPLGTVKSRLRLAMGRIRQATETLQ